MWSIRPNTGASVPSAAMRIALAANRASGGGLDPGPLMATMVQAGAEVVVDGCDAAALERLAAASPDRLAVAGGDGTIGPVAALAGRLGVPLAVIGSGTANDFARANGLPADPVAAARLAASATATRALDLGRLADDRPFVNVASAGLASVAARPPPPRAPARGRPAAAGPSANAARAGLASVPARRAEPLKPRLGALAYAAGALRAAATERPLACRVRVDGRAAVDSACWQVI